MTPFEIHLDGDYSTETVERMEDRLAQFLSDLDGQIHSPVTGNTIQLEEKPNSEVDI